MSPSPGSRLARLRAAAGRKIVIDTQLPAKRVWAELLAKDAGRSRRLRVSRLDPESWQFTMLRSAGRVLRVHIDYVDGGNSRSLAQVAN